MANWVQKWVMIVGVLCICSSAAHADANCAKIISGAPTNLAKEMLTHSSFQNIYDYQMFSDLGAVTGLKDVDMPSRGRLMMSTSKGVIVTFSPLKDKSFTQKALWVYHPFEFRADIVGLRPAVGSRSKKQAVVLTRKSVAVILDLGWTVDLPTGTAGILNADFLPDNRVAVVQPKHLLVYQLPRIMGEPAELKLDIAAQKQFDAAAIDRMHGRVVASDDNELVVFDEQGQRKVIAELSATDSPIDRIVIGDLGTRFYTRQGDKLSFYDFDGRSYGSVDIGGPLYSMDWNISDSQIALSSPAMTLIYNLDTQKAIKIGAPGDQWRRVAWSKKDGLLITLGLNDQVDPSAKTSVWSIDIWDPITGQKLMNAYREPLKSEQDFYPYLAGLQGSIGRGDFQFYLVHANAELSHFVQGPAANKDLGDIKPKNKNMASGLIVIPDNHQRPRKLN